MTNSKANTGNRHEKHVKSDYADAHLQLSMCVHDVVVDRGSEGGAGCGGGGGDGLPDAERISKGNKADTSNHADAAVGALEQLHAGCACLKHQFHFVGGGVT